MTTQERERERLEREANLARARLATTIDEIDRRAHEAIDVRLQIRRNVVPVTIVGVAIALPVLGGIGFVIYRQATRERRRGHDRLLALKRWWRHPERVARESRSLFFRIGERILVGAATLLVMTALKRLIDGRFPPQLVAARR